MTYASGKLQVNPYLPPVTFSPSERRGISSDVTEKRVSHFIREWRQYRGLKQAELAERAGTTEATVSRLESGKMAYTQKMIEALAAALGTEPGLMIGHNPGKGAQIYDLLDKADDRERRAISEVAETILRYRPEEPRSA